MVRDLGEGSTDEMVLGLLRAEINSPQCGSDYAKMLDSFGFDRSALIDNGDLTDTYASHVRAIMLSMVRGYGRNILLFHRFPKDVKWRHVSIDPTEFHRLRYVGNQEFWMELTQGTRLIDDGARNYNGTQIEAAVDAILENMRRGDTMPEIILVDDNQNNLVVIEGNRRVTAFAIARPNEVRALLGTSPTMARWHFI